MTPAAGSAKRATTKRATTRRSAATSATSGSDVDDQTVHEPTAPAPEPADAAPAVDETPAVDGARVATKARTRKPARDAVLEGAVELARAAAVEAADNASDVGAHEGAVTEGERLVSHRFACELKGYRGWHWTVTLSRVPRGRSATLCEVALLPGDGALVAPEWLPWSERLRPGDVGPGDVLPFRADDPRLEPGYQATGDEEEDAVAIGELALARARILSRDGRDEAAQRWYDGEHGPATSVAIHAAASCASCGFLVPLQGALGQVFGACVNEWSPDDGKVVSLDHGCGAHSETDSPAHPSDWPDPAPLIDESRLEVVALEAPSAADAAVAELLAVLPADETEAGPGVEAVPATQ